MYSEAVTVSIRRPVLIIHVHTVILSNSVEQTNRKDVESLKDSVISSFHVSSFNVFMFLISSLLPFPDPVLNPSLFPSYLPEKLNRKYHLKCSGYWSSQAIPSEGTWPWPLESHWVLRSNRCAAVIARCISGDLYEVVLCKPWLRRTVRWPLLNQIDLLQIKCYINIDCLVIQWELNPQPWPGDKLFSEHQIS